MNVTCPECATIYRVDPARIPAGGVLAKCDRCPATFRVADGRVDAENGSTTYGEGGSLPSQVRPTTFGGPGAGAEESEGAATGETGSIPNLAGEAEAGAEYGAQEPGGIRDVGLPVPGAEDDAVESAVYSGAADVAFHAEGAEAGGTETNATDSEATEAGSSASPSEAQDVDDLPYLSGTPGLGSAGFDKASASDVEMSRSDEDGAAAAEDRADSPGTGDLPVAEDRGDQPAPDRESDSGPSRSDSYGGASGGFAALPPLEGSTESGMPPADVAGSLAADGGEAPSGEAPLPPPPFGARSDPHRRATRLARALVSDIVVYHPDRRARSLRQGTLRQEFRDEIRKSWEEYANQVGGDFARQTSYFRDALNEILADGATVF